MQGCRVRGTKTRRTLLPSHRQWRLPTSTFNIAQPSIATWICIILVVRSALIESTYTHSRCQEDTGTYSCARLHLHISISERWRCQFETLITFSFNTIEMMRWYTWCGCCAIAAAERAMAGWAGGQVPSYVCDSGSGRWGHIAIIRFHYNGIYFIIHSLVPRPPTRLPTGRASVM